MGFSVWESQLEKEQGRGMTPVDMQRGVRNAAVVILLLTPGIFQSSSTRERTSYPRTQAVRRRWFVTQHQACLNRWNR